MTSVSDNNRLQLCIFGGGHALAYVLDNDLYYLPDGQTQAVRITNDGIPGEIYNGHTDWVYEGKITICIIKFNTRNSFKEIRHWRKTAPAPTGLLK